MEVPVEAWLLLLFGGLRAEMYCRWQIGSLDSWATNRAKKDGNSRPTTYIVPVQSCQEAEISNVRDSTVEH